MVLKNKEDLDSISESMDTVNLVEYWHAINARKWLILLLVIVSVATTFTLTKQSPTYQASTTIVLSSGVATIFNTPTMLNQIILSDILLKDIIKQGKFKYTIGALRRRVRSEITSSLVTIFVTDSRPANAKKIANMAAARFIKQAKLVEPSTNKLATRLAATRETLAWLETTLKTLYVDGVKDMPPNLIIQELLLVNQRTTLLNQEAAIIDQINEMVSTKIISPANQPTTPIPTNIKADLLFSGLAALIVGIGLAMAFKPTNKEVAA